MCFIHIYVLESYNTIQLNSNNIISSQFQTKEWRTAQKWYINGKKNECEKYQEYVLSNFLNQKLNKNEANNYRLNLSDNSLIYMPVIKNKMSKHELSEMSFEFSENFDFMLNYNNKKILFNLKFICESGGAQVRSLKEVYHFVRAQYIYSLNNNTEIYFVNILDGDFCYKNMNKFKYLKKKYKKCNVFIGDSKTFISNYSFE